MKFSLLGLEIAVVACGLAVLLIDLWLPPQYRRWLGYGAATALGAIFLASFAMVPSPTPINGMFIVDDLALFFKRFFLVTGIIVLLMTVDFAERLKPAVSEFFALILFGLSGMMLAASTYHFAMLFVALEVITVTFYVLVSYQRRLMGSIEAGVKYLILSALASGFLVYGIALVYGTSGHLDFEGVSQVAGDLGDQPLFLGGLLLILAGLGFKIAAVPFHIWTPDVYQGAPVPTTAFLAVGSKAAGFVLLLRVLYSAVPDVTVQWDQLLLILAAITILYGNLCAIPQRNLKRLLGYSSIAHAGYLLMGIAAMSQSGSSALLYYLAGYLFAVLAAFSVVALVTERAGHADISALAGLNQRAPLLAGAMTLSMISLTGIPPLAGFFGKFLLLKAVVEQGGGAPHPGYYWLAGAAILGVAISVYYYFGVIRTIFWSQNPPDLSPIAASRPLQVTLGACLIGMLYLGIFPDYPLNLASQAVQVLHF